MLAGGRLLETTSCGITELLSQQKMKDWLHMQNTF